MANNAPVPSLSKQQVNRAINAFWHVLYKNVTPLSKCDVPRWGYHGGGVYGSAQINVRYEGLQG